MDWMTDAVFNGADLLAWSFGFTVVLVGGWRCRS